LGRASVVALQAIVDPYNASFDPSVDASRAKLAAPQLCRIDIDGRPLGTGFLVKPHLVLTSFHVVRGLIDAGGKEKPGSEKRLTIVFDDRRELRSGQVSSLQEVPIAVPQNWLADSSRCLPVELLGTKSDAFAKKIHAQNGPWDYALIRLNKVASLEHTGLPLSLSKVENNVPIVVFHHAQGRSMVGNRGTVEAVLGNGVRFKHTANTDGGSSGGPCFNDAYEVIGIHQAGRRPARKLARRLPNRAVPIRPIAEKLKPRLSDPPPEMKPIIVLESGEPVLGREVVQQWAWRAVAKDGPIPAESGGKILVVKGGEGRGRKFTLAILRTLLAGPNHIVADLDAGNMVEDTPVTFAGKVLTALHADVSLLPEHQNLTTDVNWLRLTLMKRTLEAIDRVRGNRTVWLGIVFPNDGDLPENTKIREALDALYGQVKTVDWLRLMLLGLRIDLPEEVRKEATIETLKPVSADEVMSYLLQRWTPSGAAVKNDQLKAMIDDWVEQAWGTDPEKPPPDYHSELVATIRRYEVRIERSLRSRG
jgi:V8-like Glu-specific endopeptidase